MFPFARTSPLKQRALDALGLVRSFLLLEDDDAVDWEVDGDGRKTVDHPHRAPLRGWELGELRERRRLGQPQERDHACLSPISRRQMAHEPRARTLRKQSPSTSCSAAAHSRPRHDG